MNTKSLFSGCPSLIRFIFRRDRIRLSVWLIGLAGCVAAFAPVFDALFTTDMERMVTAEMMLNPAMVAILGPVHGIDHYHTGALFSNMMLLFSAITAGVMNIFLISRHTRQDEEQGRLEVIRSLPVGRLANLGSALAAAGMVNITLALFTAIGLFALRADGMTLNGCLLFGAALGVTGMFFAAATAVFCQITSNNRTAMGFSFLLLMVLYLIRAMGDLGYDTLSLISPLGLVLKTETFVRDLWWPIPVLTVLSALLCIAALALCRIRDLNRGLIGERPGRAHAARRLSSPLGLSLRLMKTTILVWTISIFVIGAMYGSIFGDMDAFISNNQMIQLMFSADTDFSMADQFIGMLNSVMAMFSAIPVLSMIHRIHGEEKHGYSEHLIGRSVSRVELLSAYLIPSFLTGILLMVLTALGFWSAGSMVLDTVPSLDVFLKSALVYLPALWVQMGLSLALTAWLPGKLSLSYIYLGYSFVAVYFGAIAGLPEWMKNLTPFGYIPQVPMEEIRWPVMIILSLIAALLGLLGSIGYCKRDLKYE